MLKVQLSGFYGPITLTMLGRQEDTCDILLDGDPVDVQDLRRWLETDARGLFGHMILDGERARPSDVQASLFNGDPYILLFEPKVLMAETEPVDPHHPPGAVF
jgi:hypothetical protein